MDQRGASELAEWKAWERRGRDGSEPKDLRERKFLVMIWLKDSVAARESLARRVPADSKASGREKFFRCRGARCDNGARHCPAVLAACWSSHRAVRRQASQRELHGACDWPPRGTDLRARGFFRGEDLRWCRRVSFLAVCGRAPVAQPRRHLPNIVVNRPIARGVAALQLQKLRQERS